MQKVVDNTILHTPFLDRFLWFPPEQHPLVCQVKLGNPSAQVKLESICLTCEDENNLSDTVINRQYARLPPSFALVPNLMILTHTLQLGGSNPETLAAAVRKVVEYGYDEINLNCGCPRCAAWIA